MQYISFIIEDGSVIKVFYSWHGRLVHNYIQFNDIWCIFRAHIHLHVLPGTCISFVLLIVLLLLTTASLQSLLSKVIVMKRFHVEA